MYLSPTGVRTSWPPAALQRGLQAPVREDRHDEDPAGQGPAREPVEGADAEELVAVDDVPVAVDDHEAVGVAVEGEAQVGAAGHDLGREGRRGGGAAAGVDVHAVGLVVDDVDAGPGRGEDLGCGRAAGAVRAVEDDVQVARRRPREALAVVPVAVREGGGVDDAADPGVPRAAELLGAPDQLLQGVLGRLVELEPPAVEHLEAVVVGGVVRGRHHDAGREAARPGEEREGRRREDPGHVHVAAQARGAGGDGGHEHAARAPGVLADHHGAARPRQLVRNGATERVGDGGPEVDVGDAADPVRAEEASHRHGAGLGDGEGLGADGAVGAGVAWAWAWR